MDKSTMDVVERIETRRLVSAKADGVLGEFDHKFAFEEPGHFAIVYGPNGVGKTRVLEIINALCKLSSMSLISLPFKSAELDFSDGSRLRVSRVMVDAPDENQDEAETGVEADLIDDAKGVKFELWKSGSLVATSRVSGLNEFQRFVQKNSPYQPTDDIGIWEDPNDGERISFDILQRRYLPRYRVGNVKAKAKELLTIDPVIQEFAESLDVRLIETQRLMGLSPQVDTRHEIRYRFGGESSQQSKPTITQYSEQIKQSLDNNLSANSRLTQSLDSTFPRRMLERGDQSLLTEQELRAKWAEQTTRRARLTEIADLNVDPALSLPEGQLNTWQLGMLELYLADADAKLDSFSHVLKRIDLLEEIVNARLLRKSLSINANDGLVVTRQLDDSSVPLTALSSGEQHEIILMFDLLFNVQPGSIVMIDEPEISLHIGWQKKFISDVHRISDLVGFQFVVATHSPQIIGRWWKNATKLGPTAADFLGEEESEDDA
ncbi:AAA family ATPase [Arthrobacter sp. IK3]|uniref:AAA family ATPase n=1 Tax=Arthrobacter sp. IK3 TaxID=3448169 RepID=UPI003EE18970